jgi:hypothetical protein
VPKSKYPLDEQYFQYTRRILLEARARTKSQPTSPLSLTRRADLLDLELPEPDLSIYEVDHDE